jgi:methyl-accepting chemotaxis protein
MGDIASASGEQSKGIGQVGIAVRQMDAVTQQNVSLVHQSALSSVELEKQAHQLNDIVAMFRIAKPA